MPTAKGEEDTPGPRRWFVALGWADRVYQWVRLVAAIVIVVSATVAVLRLAALLLQPWEMCLGLAAGVLLLRLRATPRNREFAPGSAPRDHVKAVLAVEDLGVQNHLSSVVTLRPGRFVRMRTWLLLRAFSLWYRTWYVDVTAGRLQNVRSIHFCQWTLLDGGRRLLFLTNYDGNWTSYMDDFVEHVGRGVALIWSVTQGFPGANNTNVFKRWARTQQQPHQMWYTAYPNLTVLQIANNDAICRCLHVGATLGAARQWCARLTAIPQNAGGGRVE